ncbi:MAG TPA: hypothetical protein DDW76_35750, partial [Cyanobacteria bacterium UBA11369]|nr:hypothetical protein [Cyanobacteria bacterium UBA11369]
MPLPRAIAKLRLTTNAKNGSVTVEKSTTTYWTNFAVAEETTQRNIVEVALEQMGIKIRTAI